MKANIKSSVAAWALFLCCSALLLAGCKKDDTDYHSWSDEKLLSQAGIAPKDFYYWSNGEKIYLSVAGKIILAEPNYDLSDESLADDPRHRELRVHAYVRGYGAGLILLRSYREHFGKLFSENQIDYKSLFKQFTPAFVHIKTQQEYSTLIPNGKVLIKPKDSASLEAILRELEYEITMEGTDENDLVIIRVHHLPSTLPIANRIHESGMVEWSRPDFHDDSGPILFDR
jgi:hypothetical protein